MASFRAARFLGIAAAFCCGAALPAATAWAALRDRMTWEAWVHESAGHFDWTPFIHPPLYNEVLWLGERAGVATGLAPARLLAALGIVLAGVVAAAAFEATRKRSGPRVAALATALVGLSTGAMRPFEQYPLSRALVLLAALGTLGLAGQKEGLARWLGPATFVLGLLALELHVNAWLVLGPLALLLAARNPGRRRALLALIAAWAAAFGLTALRGLPQVIADGPMNEPGWGPPLDWHQVTVERSDPLLLLLPLLWTLPAVRRAAATRVGLALGATLVLHAAVVSGQMFAGLAIGGGFENCHHYWELVDALMALAAAWALADAWGSCRRWPGRGAVLVLAAAAVAAQVWVLLRAWRVMSGTVPWEPGTSWM